MKPEPTTAQSTLPIRLLTEADLSAALPLLEKFYRLEHPGAPFDPHRARASWGWLIRSGFGALLGGFIEQQFMGLIGLSRRTDFYNSRVIVSQICWWIDDAAKASSLGLRLLDAGEWWAHHSGADDVIFGHFMNEDGAQLGNVYQRKGFKPYGMGYRKEFTPWAQSTRSMSWPTWLLAGSTALAKLGLMWPRAIPTC